MRLPLIGKRGGKVAFKQLLLADARIAAAGIPPFTAWWKQELKRFYNHPTARTLVARVGRGGAKSHTATKCLVIEAVFGNWDVPPGERHYVGFVSVNKSEAGQRLDLVEACLGALGEPFERSGDEIRLTSKPLGFRTFACTVGAVSGWRCIGFSDDELAKQMADPDAAEPAHETLASLRAMCVTHPDARRFLISSPVGKEDEHAQLFDRGNTDGQVICRAPSWIANDSISEAQTKLDEPDHRVWLREYAAEPQDAALAAFPTELVDSAFSRRPPPDYVPCQTVVVADPSKGTHDTWAFGIARQYVHKTDHNARPFYVLESVDGVEGGIYNDVSPIVAQVASMASDHGATEVHSDQYESFSLKSEFRRVGLDFYDHPWTNANKSTAVQLVRAWLTSGVLCLPDHPALKSQMARFQERITKTGAIGFAGIGAHDDYVSLVLMFAAITIERLLPSSGEVPHSLYDAYAKPVTRYFGPLSAGDFSSRPNAPATEGEQVLARFLAANGYVEANDYDSPLFGLPRPSLLGD